MSKVVRAAVLIEHPIQHFAPALRLLAPSHGCAPACTTGTTRSTACMTSGFDATYGGTRICILAMTGGRRLGNIR